MTVVYPDINMSAEKIQAIKKIKLIQSSRWNRHVPEAPKGNLAVKLWNDDSFAYGMEYGAIVVLMQVFDITIEDLHLTSLIDKQTG